MTLSVFEGYLQEKRQEYDKHFPQDRESYFASGLSNSVEIPRPLQTRIIVCKTLRNTNIILLRVRGSGIIFLSIKLILILSPVTKILSSRVPLSPFSSRPQNWPTKT